METKESQFFVIGVQRCFTTWVEKTLSKSEDVEMAKPLPPSKEPKYFLKQNASLEEYESVHYRKRNKCNGDKSVCYIESPTAMSNISKIYPNAKIIICVRDPLKRTLSHFFYNKLNNIEPRSLEEVFLSDSDRPHTDISSMDPFLYIQRSQYSNYIKQFMNDNTLVVVSESLPSSGIHQICEFIGAKPPEEISSRSENESVWNDIPQSVISRIKHRLRTEKCLMEDCLGRKIPEWD